MQECNGKNRAKEFISKKSGDEGSEYNVKAYAPGDLSKVELEACIAIIKRGCAVDPASAEKQLPAAKVLVVARKGDDIVGVGAIKQVRPEYASGIGKKSGFPLNRDTPELGYVAVDLKHRGQGLSHRIVTELLSRHERELVATTSNDFMKRTLEKAEFVQKGCEWKGQKGQLTLWVRAKRG